MGPIPWTNENFYELAWRARGLAFFERVKEAANGNLCRALGLFNSLNEEYMVALEGIPAAAAKKSGLDPGGGSPRGYLGMNAKLARAPRKAGDRPAEILERVEAVVDKGKIRKTAVTRGYNAFVANWLRDVSGAGFDAIVELGTGYGQNLFEIYCRGGPKTRYIGAEYTASGRELMGKFHALDPAMPLEIVAFDHKAPDLSFLAGAEKVLLFTCHSLEQVERLPERFFDVLAAAAPEVTAIHLKPFGFQIEKKSSASRKQAAFIKKKFYNMNLAKVLRAAEKRGKLAVRMMVLNAINPDESNPTSIAVWDNRRP
ncbi:MAG: hypothetical protein EXR04_05330 [Rhodospirillales bacterium]|nr:hypothetical protein [Rhodospirillales bacterium]